MRKFIIEFNLKMCVLEVVRHLGNFLNSVKNVGIGLINKFDYIYVINNIIIHVFHSKMAQISN